MRAQSPSVEQPGHGEASPVFRPGGARAWIVFLAAAFIYVLAVAARTSFAVAVPQAGDRFPGGSGVLAFFVVLQLAVYATAQVPVGLLLDRYGARRVLISGAVIVALGQALLALADTVGLAVAARVLVGAGDATAFIGTLRLIPAWFPLGRVPLMSQMVSVFGQVGQVISAVPFLLVLHARGWAPAFLALSGLGLGVALVALAVLRDAPAGGSFAVGTPDRMQEGHPATTSARQRESVGRTIAVLLSRPGTWLGFFTHWVGMMPAAVLTLMWGLSWMTQGLGVSATTASAALSASTLAGVVGSLVAGVLSGRLPRRRSASAVGAMVLALLAWTAGLLLPWPTTAALAACTMLGFTGPFSGIGFDTARSFNEPSRWGTCTGLVNMGGFLSTILAVQVVGLVLDHLGGERSTSDFRTAFACAALVWLTGLVGLLVSWAVTRRQVRQGRATASF
ncbi:MULTISPECIES: MFS transporter [Actinomyces]|uniref:MFS transporter n=1 Tax=Actinomyces respiraculi TaxID=2744574 RepID=A0A7T0PXX1_9ACTO|nr:MULTISPECIES: MFS transporter [Actinomyces]QPL06260.1 MFS transporter [Actinomyces respiraculi]